MKELGHPKMVFRDMHRKYYRIDGDAQDYYYDGTPQHVRALVWKNSYQNKILASHSIFKFEDIELVNYHCHPAIKGDVAV